MTTFGKGREPGADKRARAQQKRPPKGAPPVDLAAHQAELRRRFYEQDRERRGR